MKRVPFIQQYSLLSQDHQKKLLITITMTARPMQLKEKKLTILIISLAGSFPRQYAITK